MSLFEALKSITESLYDCKCSIIEYTHTTDENTGITSLKDVMAYKDVPCRISFESFPISGQTENINNITQKIKLFISPDIEIKPGSRIEINKNGEVKFYSMSGISAKYISHQEIFLENYKKEA